MIPERSRRRAPAAPLPAADEIRIDRFAGGRMVESWFIPDRMTLWQQLGFLPAPASS